MSCQEQPLTVCVRIAGVRVMFSMLPSAKSTRDAFLGRDGVVKAERGCIPSLFIDCSTMEPAESRRLRSEIQETATLHHDSRPFEGCSAAQPAFLDAPVSGGVAAARSGSLTFMVCRLSQAKGNFYT